MGSNGHVRHLVRGLVMPVIIRNGCSTSLPRDYQIAGAESHAVFHQPAVGREPGYFEPLRARFARTFAVTWPDSREGCCDFASLCR
jgi:hypothetical protein